MTGQQHNDPIQADRRPAGPALSYRQLEIFHAIMETGSVNAASRVLNISQPSLSRSLQRLEDQLRLQLFQRHRKRLIATEEAHRLYEMVAPAISQMQAIVESVMQIAEGEVSLFRFATTQSLGRVLVPRAIRQMQRNEPGLRIFLDAITRSRHVEYLAQSKGECILSLADIDHPILTRRDIALAPLVALVRKDHPLAECGMIDANDLAGHPTIMFEHSGPHSNAIEAFLGDGRRPADTIYIRFSDAAVGLAAEGAGIALVDGFTAMGWLPPGLVRVELRDPPSFTARLYWHSERPGTRFVRMLGDVLAGLASGRSDGRHTV